MKTNYKTENHNGVQPIRVLQHNITRDFENLSPEFLKLARELADNGVLNPGISYFMDEEPIIYSNQHYKGQTPFVNQYGKIALHETFLSYIWIISYSMWVLYEEAVYKPNYNLINGEKIHEIDLTIIEKTKELFQYGKSLIVSYSSWDKEYLPNPEEYSDEEEYHILRTNGIFTKAISFILCHEYAHIEKKHIQNILTREVSNDERKIFEKEADDRAIELMLSAKNGENDKTIDLGILMGLASMLFFKSDVEGGAHHPDTDSRITNFLEKLDIADDDNLWGIASLFFKLWEEQFSLSFTWAKSVGTFKELFYDTLPQVK